MQEKNITNPVKKNPVEGQLPETGKQGGQGQGDIGKKGGDTGQGDLGKTGKTKKVCE